MRGLKLNIKLIPNQSAQNIFLEKLHGKSSHPFFITLAGVVAVCHLEASISKL